MNYRINEPTSQAAFEKMVDEGRLSERRSQVLSLVIMYPERTSQEYARHMANTYPSLPIASAVESPHKRLPELMDKGWVYKNSIRECEETGNYVFTWKLTPEKEQELQKLATEIETKAA